MKICLYTEAKEQKCPNCGAFKKRIHDYRTQTIKDLPFQENACFPSQILLVESQADTNTL